MSINYNQKTWANGESGNTPIIADDLNRMEQGIADAIDAINRGGGGGGGTGNYPDLTNKPSINGMELLGSMNIGLLSTNIKVSAGVIAYNQVVSVAPVTSGASPSRMTIRSTVRNALDSLKAFVNKNVFNENVHGLQVKKSNTTNRYSFEKWESDSYSNPIMVEGAEVWTTIGVLDDDGNVREQMSTNISGMARKLQQVSANKHLANIENTTTEKNVLRAETILGTLPTLGRRINNQYVRITSGYTYTSTDNKTWTQTANNLTDSYYNMELGYCNNVYVLVAYAGYELYLFYSSDLLTWTKADMPSDVATGTEYWADDTYGNSFRPFVLNNKFYLYMNVYYQTTTIDPESGEPIEKNMKCMSSTNGVSWSEETLDSTALSIIYGHGNDTIYQDEELLIIPYLDDSSSPYEMKVAKTTNGTTWSVVGTAFTTNQSNRHGAIKKFSHNYFLTYDEDSYIYHSPDLEDWHRESLTDGNIFFESGLSYGLVNGVLAIYVSYYDSDLSITKYGVLYCYNRGTAYDYDEFKFLELPTPVTGAYECVPDDWNDVNRTNIYFLQGGNSQYRHTNFNLYKSTAFLTEVYKATQELGIGASSVAITVSGETLNITT